MAKKEQEKDQAPEEAGAGNAGENTDTPPDESKPGEGLADPEQGKNERSLVHPAPSIHGKAAVVSESRKGKTIIAVSGEPIVFDNEGKATVNEEDALYLKNCPGFIVG
jgi:hypothetical protein